MNRRMEFTNINALLSFALPRYCYKYYSMLRVFVNNEFIGKNSFDGCFWHHDHGSSNSYKNCRGGSRECCNVNEGEFKVIILFYFSNNKCYCYLQHPRSASLFYAS